MLDQWQFGYVAIIGGVLFPVIYLLIRQLRCFGAWVNRDQGPKERTGAYIVMLSLLGIFVGGLSQSFVDMGVYCSKLGKPVIGCTIENMLKLGATKSIGGPH